MPEIDAVAWHIAQAKISLATAARLGSRDAAYALKILTRTWPSPGRPPIDDSRALQSIARIGGAHAIGAVTGQIPDPKAREAAARRYRRKRHGIPGIMVE